MTVKIFHVDAFTVEPFSRNPAAVRLLPRSRDAEWMQKGRFSKVSKGRPAYRIVPCRAYWMTERPSLTPRSLAMTGHLTFNRKNMGFCSADSVS